MSLVEIVLAIAIFSIISIGVFNLSIDTIQRDSKIELSNQAVQYAQEGIEAVRNMRDRDFLSLTNGDHGLNLSGGSWTFIAAPEDIDGFYSRTITIEDVYRDGSGDIASSGTFDPDTKLVISEIDWTLRGFIPRSVTLSTYLSNWTGDDWLTTTCSEFDQGTYTDTESTSIPAPPIDNCAIQLVDSGGSGSFFASANVGSHGRDVVVDGGYAYMAVNSASSGFAIIDVSDPASPSIVKQLYTWNKGRQIAKEGNFAYLGIERTNPAIAIINVTNPLTAAVTYAWALDGYGNEPAASGNYLYTTVNSDDNGLSVYDISLVPYATDFLSVGAAVQAITLNGNYAYVGTDNDSSGLKVINISNPNNVSVTASLDVGEEVNAIAITGITAFVGTEDSDDSLQVINISNPANPVIITSLDVGGEIQDLVIQGDYLYAAVDDQNAGLATIDITNPLSPNLTSNSDIQGKGTGIDADENYVYISTDTANKGLVIVGAIRPGVATSGSYISETFDTGSADTRYNFIEWDHTEVPGGTVKFQIRTASTPEGLDSATWVGSDGTNGTYYENARTAITLDPMASGNRYFQYQAFIDSDGVSTPQINSIRINYTP